MKVLFLDQFSDLGGAQQVLLELLPAVREKGWRAAVAMPGDGPLFGKVEALGFRTARIACGPYRSGRKSIGDVGRFVRDLPRLASQIRALADGADLVYVNGARLLPAVARADAKSPVLFHCHSFVPRGGQWLVRTSLRRSRALVTGCCESVATPWRTCANVRVVYNGVAGPPAPFWSASAGVIGCVGRVAPQKGQREFVSVASRIAAEVPEGRFTIYGEVLFGDAAAMKYEHEVKAAAAGLPIEFAGWTADIYAALAGMQLLLVPSVGPEATTRVILEAFAAGVPVIAFRSGGIPEIIEHERTGWLAGSAEEMAQLAVHVLRDPKRACEVSRAAREEWETRFGIERFHREMLALMEEAAHV